MADKHNYRLQINGTLLSRLRKEMGLSQEKLAGRADVSEGSIRNYEHKGVHGIHPETLKKVANALAVEPAVLIVTEDIDTTLETEVQPPLVHNIEAENGAFVQQDSHQEPLRLNKIADELLTSICDGLLFATGSPERVSLSISNISAYLCSIVNQLDGLKNHSHLIISAVAPALSKSELDTDGALNADLWASFKNSMSELSEIDVLPHYARKEIVPIVDLITQARLNDDNNQRHEAIKRSLFWINDNWQLVFRHSDSYNAFRDVASMLRGAPTDYETRQYIVTSINAFISWIPLYDKHGIYHRKVQQ